MSLNTASVYHYKACKVNKHSTNYECLESTIQNQFVTQQIKIEKFQQQSNAYNLGEYYRIKNKSSWAKSSALTGVWRTNTKNVYYGDTGKHKPKALILFKFSENKSLLTIHVYPLGFCPPREQIERLAQSI